ncbi:major capsid protein P2 [Pseudoalteromonas rubra]|uniref:major capsid protein P2 n=1 Tax=Pseudoalteromonas rubra TaxID=43658 RepID=UPI002DBF1C7D|nr:major capsid protein P2 [Pseudoalteromonas rubra]MEC4091145.1 major capsid protein P2 [Pseudoalteromonas rubra]
MLEISKLNNLTGVTPGGTASLSLPIGRTYEKIHFQFENIEATEIRNFRIELNGKMLSEWKTLQDMLNENAYYRREQLDGYATLYFTRPEVESVMHHSLSAQRFFALGTSGLSIAQIKFDIGTPKNDQQGNPLTPIVNAYTEKREPSPPGWLFKRRTFAYNWAVGVNEVENLPRPNGARIALIELKHPSVKSAEFLVDNVTWREKTPTVLHNHIIKQRGRAVQPDTYAVDLALSGDVFSSLVLTPQISDMRLRVECEQAGPAEVVVHYFDDYANSAF